MIWFCPILTLSPPKFKTTSVLYCSSIPISAHFWAHHSPPLCPNTPHSLSSHNFAHLYPSILPFLLVHSCFKFVSPKTHTSGVFMLMVNGWKWRLDTTVTTRRQSWWKVFRPLGADLQRVVLLSSGLFELKFNLASVSLLPGTVPSVTSFPRPQLILICYAQTVH